MDIPRIEDTQQPHLGPPLTLRPPFHQRPRVPITRRVPIPQRVRRPLHIVNGRRAALDLGQVQIEDGLAGDFGEDPVFREAVVGAPVAVGRGAAVDAAEDAAVVVLRGPLGGEADVVFGDQGRDGGDGFVAEVFGCGGGGEVRVEGAQFGGGGEVGGFFSREDLVFVYLFARSSLFFFSGRVIWAYRYRCGF